MIHTSLCPREKARRHVQRFNKQQLRPAQRGRRRRRGSLSSAMACDAVKTKVEVEETVVDEPVSPTGQYFNSSVLSIGILAIFESDVAIDDSPTMSTLESLFLPIHPRFSSVMVKDDHGVRRWKRVTLKLEDHVTVPVFPAGLETYDDYMRGYISNIAVEEFAQSRPLWDLHILKYPTKSAAGTMVFRIHHALGDGFSLMSALFTCFRRADDASLPLTFPSSRATKPVNGSGAWWRAWRNVPRGLSVCMNTVRDLGWSLLKTNYLADDRTPVRSEEAGVEFRPMEISTVTLSLDEVRHVKAKLGGVSIATVNDVISGTIFYGTQLYLQAKAPGSKEARVTALVLLNARMIASYQSSQEMTRPDATNPWGNNFGFLHVPIPVSGDPDASDPVSFVLKARQIIKAKRSSLAVHLNGRLLETIRKLRGAETAARYIHSTLRNTSMTISNLAGPMEQMIIAGHPVGSFYFMTVGSPQSLTVSVVSYMGKLKVAMGTEKGFIDAGLLVSCMEKSFRRISEAAAAKRADHITLN
ncbi:hypothetical protein BHM03_00034006 [Ensete ventricosum]|nr:hypothetical protein BHM03_00034006 [Ensete ventricosum]